METLFELTVYTYQEWRRRYPRYSISKYGTYYCHTLVEAEDLLRQLILNKDNYGDLWIPENIHHFTINEYPYGNMAYFITSRIYDYEGDLVDQSLCPSNCKNGEFHGRPEEMVRFEQGDIVEMMLGDEIELGFVVGCPVDTKWAELVNSEHPLFDDTDDSYVILTTSDYGSHNHVQSLDVFRPMFPIPNPTLNRLQNAFEKFVENEAQHFINSHKGQYIVLLPEPAGWELYSKQWRKDFNHIECQYVSPRIIIHILQRPIILCPDDRSFEEFNGKRKMAFVVEDMTHVPEEYREESIRIGEAKSTKEPDISEIFDIDSIPMSKLDEAYIEYKPIDDDIDFFPLDEQDMNEEK